jgi:hypothetical protein
MGRAQPPEPAVPFPHRSGRRDALVPADGLEREQAQQADREDRQQAAQQHPARRVPGERGRSGRPELRELANAGVALAALVPEQVHAHHRDDHDQVGGHRQRREPRRPPVQPEPAGAVQGVPLDHPAGQVGQRERQQQEPAHPARAARGQAAPGVGLDDALTLVGGAVEAGDPVAGHLLRGQVAEQVLRGGAADAVQPDLDQAAALLGERDGARRAGDGCVVLDLYRHVATSDPA